MKNTVLKLFTLSLGLTLLTGCPNKPNPTDNRIYFQYKSVSDLRDQMNKVGIKLTIDPSVENSEYIQTQLKCLIGAAYSCVGFNDISEAQQKAVIDRLKDVKEVVITLAQSVKKSGDAKVLQLYTAGYYGDTLVTGGQTFLSNSIVETKGQKGTSSFDAATGVLTLGLSYSSDSSSTTFYKTKDATVFKSISSEKDQAFILALEGGQVVYLSKTGDGVERSTADAYYTNILVLLGIK